MTGDATRVLVTGSRSWVDARAIHRALEACQASYGGRLVIVHGACPRGADEIAARWCARHGVRQERHPADWATLGRRAGMARNAAMVDSNPALVLAFIQDGSPGASHCAAYATAHGVPVHRYERSRVAA